MDVRLFILSFLLILGGCLPGPQVSKGRVANQSGESSTPLDPSIPQTETQWNYLAGNFSSITIYASNLNNAYLTGYDTEFYLSDDSHFKNQTYCLVSDYSIAGDRRQMRTRVVPVSYYDFNAKRTVKVLRVDFNVISSEVEATCSSNKNLYVYNSLGEYAPDSTVPATVVYAANTLCPTCTSRLTSTKLRLFKIDSDLYEVPIQSLNLKNLSLIVDSNSGTPGSGNGTCSITSCQAQGYDCCLEEQCVDNAAVRPSAITLYPEQYQTAEEERVTDPLAWLRYPHIYYICPSYIPPTPGATTGGSTGGSTTGGSVPDYQEGLAQIKKDLLCLENIKNQSQTIPFHQELLTNPSYQATPECLTETSQESLFMHFKNVAKRLYNYCGCSYSELSDMISLCPAYYYQAKTTNSLGEVTSFECSILVQETIPTTQQVSVPSRSAPHRFFNTAGVEFSSPEQSSTIQEGDNFSYLDVDNNSHVQENFGINAILGPMSLTLDKALPAKQVNVELDQIYLIRTINGYYTPCPTCGKDKWHDALTANPSSNWGVGLQAVGFSTQRDEVDGNVTGGNYEDTIFGRACWVPPTMLPFTHRALSGLDATNQRRIRLNTQAVLYGNGYQRDWFGFNKGALIGSFDGVSWFAVGNGRLAKSTSKKLYLAINAPFADLASSSIHNVQVSLYDGYSTAPQVDYDPQYHLSHSFQNQAGNCQANHMCQTDADCITRLGWEYACADVSQVKTSWPTFDPLTNKENIDAQVVTLDQILAQKKFPSSETKRCVYRGAGAVCLTNSNNIADLNSKKTMTCAPNFYCATLASSSNFSARVSRFATDLDNLIVNRNHHFGQDANVLGRPLNYLGENVSLPGESRTSIENNLRENHPSLSLSGAGICRPGKVLPVLANQGTLSNPFEQHKSADPSKRADFINQLASCNTSLFSNYRQSSCPVLDSNGNYLQFESSTLPADYHLLAGRQNACGLESISTNVTTLNSSMSTLQSYSAFKEIEAPPLNELIITNKTLTRDACFRRAGAVCHTDLECSPNKMHAENASFKPLHFFGNLAEKSYWEEYLVCGQADPKPSVYDEEATKNFDQSLNRCCREIGKDLTTITTDSPRSTTSGQFRDNTQGLMTAAHPGTIANHPKRYSRLATVENLGMSPSRPLLSANTQRDSFGILLSSNNISSLEQWKTLREANSETCCGGGWVRKFSDGSNNWSQKNRVYYDVTNFACLNSRHPILTIPENLEPLYNSLADIRNLINKDYNEYCQDITGTEGSCAQNSFNSSADTEGNPVSNPFGVITINTRLGNFGTGNTDYLFKPFSGDAHQGVTMVYNSNTQGSRNNLSIRIPSYVPRSSFDDIYNATPAGSTAQGVYIEAEGASAACEKVASLPLTSHEDVGTCSAATNCCYSFDGSNRILKLAINNLLDNNIRNNEAGIRMNVNLGDLNSVVARTRPANDLYYLNRLARTELSGIPQITHEPLYCNDDSASLLPGLFKPSLMKKKSEFENATHSFIANGRWQTTHHALVQEPVFSEDQFKCCMPLGKTTNNQNNCCSGFGKMDEESNTFTCALPTGTDLMVYLNPFVSNEGFNLGLTETNFNQLTGEPNFTPATINIISQIGRDHCVGNKVRQGGAFGNFEPEPQGTRTDVSKRIYQIVDSANDVGQVTNAGATMPSGYNVFNQGYRWNHHLYCME